MSQIVERLRLNSRQGSAFSCVVMLVDESRDDERATLRTQ